MKRLFGAVLASAVLLGTLSLTACEKKPVNEKAGTLTVTADTDADFDTVGEALGYVRTLRQNGYTEPVTVRFNGGDYYMEEPVVIDETVPDLTVEAGENGARLIGGVRIDGFEWDEFNGVKCLSASVGDAEFSDLYVNGLRASMTRYPHEGFLQMGEVENTESGLFDVSKSFTAAEGDIGEFRSMDRILVSYYNRWVDEHSPIESYDPATKTVTMRYRSALSIGAGQEYFLENVAEAFGRPDDWYCEEGRVYYVPRDDGITPDTIEAYRPVAAKLFDIRGTAEQPVRGVTLRGLDMSVTRGDYTAYKGDEPRAADGQSLSHADGSVSFLYAEDCVMEDCSLLNYGLYGVVFAEGCHNGRMSRCELRDGGAGGVRITGFEDESVPEATDHITVEDCTILSCGHRYEAGCGVLIQDANHITVQHNEIGDLGYTGVSCGWVWGYYDSVTHDNLITKNHIHDIGRGNLSDMGGVYLLGPQPGTVVSNNLIHDISLGEYGGWALYADEGTSDVVFEKNICYRAQSNVFEQHYGANNIVRNNILACSVGPLLKVSLFEEHISATFDTNILYADGTELYEFQRNHLSHKTVPSKNNLIWSTSGGEPAAIDMGGGTVWSIEQVNKFFGMEEGSVIADPEFTDAEHDDYTLKETSPAFALGFEAIDMSDVGPRQ